MDPSQPGLQVAPRRDPLRDDQAASNRRFLHVGSPSRPMDGISQSSCRLPSYDDPRKGNPATLHIPRNSKRAMEACSPGGAAETAEGKTGEEFNDELI